MLFPLHNAHSLWWAAAEILLYLVVFIAVVSLIIFLLRMPLRKYKPEDLHIFNKLKTWHTAQNNRWMLGFTYLGKHNFLIPANLLLMAVFLVFGTHYWYAFRMFVMSLSSLFLMFILKHLFHRKRPLAPLLHAAKGKSFPSGHAIMAVNFYGLILYMILQTNIPLSVKIMAAVLLIITILLIGFSRVYLQVHYLSDVLAGFIIGIAWFFTSLSILNRLEYMMN